MSEETDWETKIRDAIQGFLDSEEQRIQELHAALEEDQRRMGE